MIDKAELLKFADWLEIRLGIVLPPVYISKDVLRSKNGELDPNLGGVIQRHAPSGAYRILLEETTPNPQIMLAHEVIHYISRLDSPSEDQINSAAIKLFKEFQAYEREA